MGTKIRRYMLQRRNALLISLGLGLAGILPDVDHIVAYEKGWDYLLVRPWHTPILIGASIVLGCCCAYCGGLFIRMVLKK